MQRVQTPDGMTDTQFIDSIIKASNSYGNNLNYDIRPDITGNYNSNSYVSGVLIGAGAVPPMLDTGGKFQAPGFDKPIPLGGSGASGGSSSSSGAPGIQNLQSFSNPPQIPAIPEGRVSQPK
jgi:hypothetical protein